VPFVDQRAEKLTTMKLEGPTDLLAFVGICRAFQLYPTFWLFFSYLQLSQLVILKPFNLKRHTFNLHTRIRVSQICSFLSNLRIDVGHNFSLLSRIKALQKTKF